MGPSRIRDARKVRNRYRAFMDRHHNGRMNPDLQTLLPAPAGEFLDRFLAQAASVFGPGLQSALLFGSGAEGRLRPTSDLNLLLVVERLELGKAAALREILREGQSAVQLRVLLLEEAELPEAVLAFPEKFDDLRRRRKLLLGTDPIAALAIPPDVLRQRLRQVLLNLVLRLREAYLLKSLREEQAARVLAESAGPLRAVSASLLGLEGRDLHPKEALRALVAELAWEDGEGLLAAISTAREAGHLAPGEAPRRLLALIGLASALRGRLEGPA